MQKAKLEIRTPQGRREERKKKKDAELQSGKAEEPEGAKQSCC